jgi:formylglycine-generating enzyme required for sulfatase activity
LTVSPSTGLGFAVRGGSFVEFGERQRSASRGLVTTTYAPTVGFRCVRTLKP